MRIAIILCLGVFFMCCTGAATRTCKRLSVSTGSVAALSLLAVCASSFDVRLFTQITINAGTMLLLLFAFPLCGMTKETAVSALISLACGIAAWALQSLFPVFYEPGALLCLPAAFSGCFLASGRRQGMLCTLLAPLCFGLAATVEDWYLFDVIRFRFGSALQFDMQLCGAILFSLLMYVPNNAKSPVCRRLKRERNSA